MSSSGGCPVIHNNNNNNGNGSSSEMTSELDDLEKRIKNSLKTNCAYPKMALDRCREHNIENDMKLSKDCVPQAKCFEGCIQQRNAEWESRKAKCIGTLQSEMHGELRHWLDHCYQRSSISKEECRARINAFVDCVATVE